MRGDERERRDELRARRAEVGQPVDRAQRVARVERREDELSGQRGGDAGRDGLGIAHLADDQDVGVLSHQHPQRFRERQILGFVDLHLRDVRDADLDRIATTFERTGLTGAFNRYRAMALSAGFLECVSGPLVRSSYRAEQALARNNAGLDNAAMDPGAMLNGAMPNGAQGPRRLPG